MAKLKEVVKTEDQDKKELTLAVKHPSGRQLEEANLHYSKRWTEATFEEGLKTKKQLEEDLKSKGIWSEADDAKEDAIREDIIQLGKQLKAGKFTGSKTPMTKWQGRELAVKIHNRRNDLREHLAVRSTYDATTAEAFAENIRFDYLVSVCTVYNDTGELYFKSLEDYQNRKAEKAAWAVARKLATMMYGGDGVDFSEDYEKNVLEIKFLEKFGYIDTEGKFVDPKTKKYMNAKGEVVDGTDDVDVFGNKVDKDGRTEFVFGDFVDEEEPAAPKKEVVKTAEPVSV